MHGMDTSASSSEAQCEVSFILIVECAKRDNVMRDSRVRSHQLAGSTVRSPAKTYNPEKSQKNNVPQLAYPNSS